MRKTTRKKYNRINKKRVFILICLIMLVIFEIVAFRNSRANKIIDIAASIIDDEKNIDTEYISLEAINSGESGYALILPEYVNNKKIDSYKSRELFYKNIAVLSQNPDSIFVKKTVKLDLFEVLDGVKISKEEKNKKIDEVVKLLEIENILDMHPYDLSGGEKQKAALGKILLLDPELLILDEPTKGIDNFYKGKIIELLKDLKEKGTTIIIVTHDIEFAAEVSSRCSMFFDGNIISIGEPVKFFSENNFYTTSANKISRDILKNIVTYEDIIRNIEN